CREFSATGLARGGFVTLVARASRGNRGDVTWTRLAFVAGFGALGASLRYLVGTTVVRYVPSAPFLGTLIVNLLGCFLFGLVSQLGQGAAWVTPQLRMAILTGFLGAFTTFSSFSYDTVQLYEG